MLSEPLAENYAESSVVAISGLPTVFVAAPDQSLLRVAEVTVLCVESLAAD